MHCHGRATTQCKALRSNIHKWRAIGLPVQPNLWLQLPSVSLEQGCVSRLHEELPLGIAQCWNLWCCWCPGSWRGPSSLCCPCCSWSGHTGLWRGGWVYRDSRSLSWHLCWAGGTSERMFPVWSSNSPTEALGLPSSKLRVISSLQPVQEHTALLPCSIPAAVTVASCACHSDSSFLWPWARPPNPPWVRFSVRSVTQCS